MNHYFEGKVREQLQKYAQGAWYYIGHGQAFVDKGHTDPLDIYSPFELDRLLNEGDGNVQIFRSSMGADGEIATYDVEIFKQDDLKWILEYPMLAAGHLENVLNSILKEYARFDMPCAVSLTPSGFHVENKLLYDSDAYRALAAHGRISKSLEDKCTLNKVDSKQEHATPDKERAWAALGELFLYISLRVKQKTKSDMDIYIADSAYEGIALDLTCFTDPGYMRDMRMPWSAWQKQLTKAWKYGGLDFTRGIGALTCIPLGNLSYKDGVEIMFDRNKVIEYSHFADTTLPDGSAGWLRVFEEYKKTSLARFADDFHNTPINWKKCMKFDVYSLSEGVADIFRKPDPKLLQPICIRAFCSEMMERGYHPKFIAGVLSHRFFRKIVNAPGQRDNLYWKKYDAETRTGYYTLVYTAEKAIAMDSHKNLARSVDTEFEVGVT